MLEKIKMIILTILIVMLINLLGHSVAHDLTGSNAADLGFLVKRVAALIGGVFAGYALVKIFEYY